MTVIERINANKADGAIKMGLSVFTNGINSFNNCHCFILLLFNYVVSYYTLSMQDLLPQHLYMLLSYNRCLYTAIFYLFMAILMREESREKCRGQGRFWGEKLIKK